MKDHNIILVAVSVLFFLGVFFIACLTTYIDFIQEDKRRRQRVKEDRAKQLKK